MMPLKKIGVLLPNTNYCTGSYFYSVSIPLVFISRDGYNRDVFNDVIETLQRDCFFIVFRERFVYNYLS